MITPRRKKRSKVLSTQAVKPLRARFSPKPRVAVGINSFIRNDEIASVDIQTRTLDNGIRLVSERVSGAASSAVGLWVNVGSRNEKPVQNGISHFIEHVVFKGTEGRTMKQIMRSIESRGGMLNAYTTKEQTCFYAWTRTMHLPEAVTILHELAIRPKFNAGDIIREKSVIIEEIHGLDDEPEELLFDLFEKEMLSPSTLAMPVIGSERSVATLVRKDLIEFHKEYYRTDNMSLVVSGAQDHDEFFDVSKRLFEEIEKRPKQSKTKFSKPDSSRIVKTSKKKEGVSQSHLIVGTRAPGMNSEKLPELGALVTLLGVGMSSRLNLRLREELGLAYEASAFHAPFADAGCIGLYAATTGENTERATSEILKILKGLFTKPITATELERTKEQMIGGIVLSMESVTTRLMRTGQNETYYRRYVSLEEETSKIAKITLTSVKGIAEEIFSDESALSVVSIVPKN